MQNTRLSVKIYYLEKVVEEIPPFVGFADGFLLEAVARPSPDLLRKLYYEVGEQNFWWERRVWQQQAWQDLSESSDIRLFVLSEAETIAGFFELNFARLPRSADLAFFGLMPRYIGRGLGYPLLLSAIRYLVDSGASVLTVNTCNLDHAAALPLYQKAGFYKVSEELRQIEDPREVGLLPADLPLPAIYHARRCT